MSERVKEKRKVVYFYNELEQLVGEEETRFEPLEGAAPEFSGVVGTLSLGHGVAPPEPVGEWSILKIYEKSVIWIRHGPEGASP